MAKSKNGGTRAYIRGRIGSDVYSVGKNGKGERQQVVRSLAEVVSNPRTESQMYGRMIMSTVMQAVAGLAAVVDHSFDGFQKGQPSISEFIKQNYALVKADAQAHPSASFNFGIVNYQEKGILPGKYMISKGSALVPAAVTAAFQKISIALTAGTLTVGGLKAALGLAEEGYLTLVTVDDTAGVFITRAHLDTALADSTAITSSNVESLFAIEGNARVAISLDTNTIKIEQLFVMGTSYSYGLIVSDKVEGAWVHNNCTMSAEMTSSAKSADAALPTYPTGQQAFLNGGDL